MVNSADQLSAMVEVKKPMSSPPPAPPTAGMVPPPGPTNEAVIDEGPAVLDGPRRDEEAPLKLDEAEVKKLTRVDCGEGNWNCV